MPTCLRSPRPKEEEEGEEGEDEDEEGGARETEDRRQRKAEKPGRGTGGRAVVSSREPRVQCHLLSLVDKRSLPESAPPWSARGKERGEREKEREKGEPMARRPGLYEWAIAMQPFASFVSYLSPFIIIRPHPIYTRDPRSTLYTA